MFRKITALLFCAIFCFGSGMSTMPATAASEAENVFVEQTLQTYDGIYMQVKGSPADNYRKIGIGQAYILTNNSDMYFPFTGICRSKEIL